MTMKVIPLSSALGAEVIGVDFKKNLSKEIIQKLIKAFLKYHLLCLRSKPLNPEQFFKVACCFGTPFSETTRDQWVNNLPEISKLVSTYKSEKILFIIFVQ